MSNTEDDGNNIELQNSQPNNVIAEEVEPPNVINIRFATGQSLTLPYPSSPCTVFQFKQLIKQRVDELAHNVETCEKFASLNAEINPSSSTSQNNYLQQQQPQPKYLRLIYQGRLLVDAHDLGQVKILRGACCHCTLAERASPMESIGMALNSNTAGSAPPSALSSNNNQINSSSSNNNNNNNNNNEQAEADDDRPRGFDRLRESGFAQEDINFIRNQFYSTRQHLLAQVQSRAISQRQLHEMEEQWMSEDFTNQASSQETEVIEVYNNSILAGNNSHGSNSRYGIWSDDQMEDEYVTSSEGNYYHMFFGTLMGFLFGIIMLITFFVLSVPRKFKYGVLTGIGCNVSFALVKLFLPGAQLA